MGFNGLSNEVIESTPREKLLEALGERPTLPREPIILDRKDNNSDKSTKSSVEKLTK